MYKIKLSDGTLLDDLELNGNNFITDKELTGADFSGKLSYVEVTDDDGNTKTYYDMMLIQCMKWQDGRTWFILSEKSEQQKKEEALEQENALLKAQIKALDSQQEFLEDCLAELGQVVYA